MIASCPACNAQYRLDPARLRGGRGRLRCARCQAVFDIAAPGVDSPTVPPKKRSAPAAPAEATPSRPRIDVALVAGEAGDRRQALVDVLVAASARCITADDGPGALATARRSRPRLLVLPFQLAGLSGPEVAEAVREEPTLALARIVLVGGPPRQGRFLPSPMRVHDVDAHLPEDVEPAAAERVFRSLLGLPGGQELEGFDEVAARSAARVAVADVLSGAGGLPRDADLGDWPAPLRARFEEARAWCFSCQPTRTRQDSRSLALFDEEWEAALAQGRSAGSV